MENNIDYLRFSLTDRCNMNCIYCTPSAKSHFMNNNELLAYEEIARAVSIFVKLGIRKIRLTGGEPLIKKDIVRLVKMLKAIIGLEEIAITTNGVNLKELAYPLKKAGIDRLNISIDTLKRERYKLITGFDYFERVWGGINKAIEAKFEPVKLNVILMKGLNQDEINDFVRLAFSLPLIIRFIEFFPTNKRSLKMSDSIVKNDIVKKTIQDTFGKIRLVSDVIGNGPAEYYKLEGSKGLVGFISNYSKDFCAECNRIRIDCSGTIRPCLFSGHTYGIKSLLRSNVNDDSIIQYIKEIIKIKSKIRKNREVGHEIEMSSIGG